MFEEPGLSIENDPTGVTDLVDQLLEELVGAPLESLTQWPINQLPSHMPGSEGRFKATSKAMRAVGERAMLQLTKDEVAKASGMLSARSVHVLQFAQQVEARIDGDSDEIRMRCRFVLGAFEQLKDILKDVGILLG